ncbi:MAG TPA: DUF1800 domain-containing protein, partial [Saprospiraceae bacterium]|nr:DUF1800 domain-containing protein [Saprospiraceae bacterium]
QHLFWRLGFGPRTKSWDKWVALPEASWWPKLRDESLADAPVYFDVADSAVKGLLMGIGEIGKMEQKDLDKADKKDIREKSRDNLRSLNLHWLEEMTHSKAQLREKIALFWHGHFASRNINILYQQQMLHVIRENALGNFGDLLRGVSKSAAILAFLNNQQNKKQHPNENFAREVMELFTLGRGNYTENDIKEAARAFTGWGFKLNGDFVFRKFDHDDGSKTLLGKTGKFDGDDVLNILLEKRQTARYIALKLYKYLVNETLVPEGRITELGDRFYDSGYQIMRLLEDIVRSDWFHAPENVGNKIKSPVDLWVGIRRALPLEPENPEIQLLLQKALGQILFFPPNVAGWPGGKNWIDSSSLMLRLRIPQMLYTQSDLDVTTKDDDDQQMGQGKGSGGKRGLSATVDWQPVVELFKQVPEKELIPKIADYLWTAPADKLPLEIVQQHTDRSTREVFLKTAMIQLMATPEYQLC